MIEPIYMAAASRLAGDKHFKWPGVALYPLPYAFAAGFASESPLHAAISYAWAVVWKITGHADGFQNYVRDNFLSKYVWPIGEKLGLDRNSKAYDALFWGVKGALIPAATLDPWLIGFSAVGYPLAYWLGFEKLSGKLNMGNTEWGETLAGLFSGLGFLARRFF